MGNGWYESWDYRHYISGLGCEDAVYNSDDSFTLVLSEQDPGTVNWLEAAGHSEGHIAVRWQLTEGQLPLPQCQLVKLSEVKALTGLAVIDTEERSKQKQQYREAVEQRFRL